MTLDDSRQEILRQLRFGALSLAGVVLVGATGYHVIGQGQWSYGDCLYMTMITLSTVGYGEVLHGMESVPGARIWTLLLIVLGSGSLLFFVSSLTAFIVEGDIQGVIRRRRMQKQIDLMKDHIIVVGIGATGIHVVEELHATQVPFVVIDTNEERMRRIAEEGIPGMLFVHGDATDDHVLEQAGIARAKGLAATLPEDKDNVFVSITARALNPNLRIVSKMTEDSAESKLKRAGANATVSPSQIGGMRLASELVRPSVVQFLDTMLRDKQQALRVEEVTIPAHSKLIGARLRETSIRNHTKVLILAVHHADGAYTYNPGPDFILEPGTTLVVLCQSEDVRKLREGIESGAIGRA
ncbi:MAG TPA: potassium channel protein [Polyangiales bacterium]|jgi:voltage-gated potassium channel|nr:potassium channel protein [Polyangiales bacterium]